MNCEPKQLEKHPQLVKWDPLKKKYFEKFYQLCKQKEIVFIVAYSPFYKAKSSIQFQEMTDFCHKNNIPLIDNYYNLVISEHRDYFKDSWHLNNKGAKEYTKVFALEINHLVK